MPINVVQSTVSCASSACLSELVEPQHVVTRCANNLSACKLAIICAMAVGSACRLQLFQEDL